jgi:hypothetical protein
MGAGVILLAWHRRGNVVTSTRRELDPRILCFAIATDCRVKRGNDGVTISEAEWRLTLARLLILPCASAATRIAVIGLIAAIGALVEKIRSAGAANSTDVRAALRVSLETAIGATPDVTSTPRAVGARVDGGEGQSGDRSRDQNDAPHGKPPRG